MRIKTIIAAGLLCSASLLPTFAQEATRADPSGVFKDSYGTTFTFSLCGEGTDLCGVLNDVQGRSRTEENLQYVGQQVMQADLTAPNKWKGTVIFDGSRASATITQTGPDTVAIQGCRGIFCQTLEFERV